MGDKLVLLKWELSLTEHFTFNSKFKGVTYIRIKILETTKENLEIRKLKDIMIKNICYVIALSKLKTKSVDHKIKVFCVKC